MTDIKLLLVEDDENLAFMEKSSLEDIIGGYQVVTATNGRDALEEWRSFRPQVIVSDIDMPIMDGIEMVKRIRQEDKDTLILFTTGLTSSKDLKEGYAAGANNYVKKPFAPEELDAHIHSLLQMKQTLGSTNPPVQRQYLELGTLLLDAQHATLRSKASGKEKILTAREAQILQLLTENKNQVVLRETVLSLCWGVKDKDYFASRSLDVFIKKIRNLLGDEPQVQLLTVRGVGFKLVVNE